MARYQSVRGNPEQKLLVLNQEFSGGVNLMFADDLLRDNEMRYLSNYDLENTGELRGRKGFSASASLTQLLTSTGAVLPPITKTASTIVEIALFRLLQNDGNAWNNLSNYDTLAGYQADHGAENNVIKIIFIAKDNTGATKYYINKYTIGTLGVTVVASSGTLPFTLSVQDNLTNVVVGEQTGKFYMTDNNKGLWYFDNTDNTFHYFWTDTPNGVTSEAYKPSPIEARKIGFNMMSADPLSWLDDNGISTSSIQGMYASVLVGTDHVPVVTIPSGAEFYLTVLYTGPTSSGFTFAFSEYESPIEATVTQVTLGTGYSRYKIQFATQPVAEVQIAVNFAVDQDIEDYIDYYPVGTLPTTLTAVTGKNFGEYKIVQMYDRLAFYKGNEIWFSDVNTFSYVPNFNFVLLPIENTDEIVKIVFFRTSYIIFTKKKIFKLVGQFESANLALDIVNDDVGCVAPESIRLVDNELFFISTRGLRSLKTDVFREGLENLREFDQKVYPLITTHSRAVGIVYRNQYHLHANLRGAVRGVSIRGRDYPIPDVVRCYYLTGAFSFDDFGTDNYPRFIFFEAGEMYSFIDGKVYKFGNGYDDFGQYYDLVFETPGVSLGYPIHEKKFKHIVLKFGIDTDINNVYAEVFGDGVKFHDTTIVYPDVSDPVEIESSRFVLTKERLPTKCRNIAVRVTVVDAISVSLQALAYVFKLGKVRDHV